jgi:phosphatidylglycerol---prolipoprotein diacylglyceryl transferase
MLPILFSVGDFKIYTYGIFLVLALLWSSFTLFKLIKLTIYKEEHIFDMVFAGLFYSIILGRIVFIATHLDLFKNDIFKMILVHAFPGIHVFTVLFVFFTYCFWFCYKQKINYKILSDIMMPPVFIGLSIIKIGALFAATQIGSETNFLLAVKYAGYDGLRHITALYESIFFGFCAYLLHLILFATRRKHLPIGISLYFGIFFYALSLALSWFITDSQFNAVVYNIPISLVIPLCIVLTLIVYIGYTTLPYIKKNSKK